MINPDVPSSATRDLMTAALQAAVPLWIEQLRHQSTEHILERAKACGEHIAARGDVLQFRSRKTSGASAEAFNRLAEGLACLALTAAGGVTFLGIRWEARR